MLNQSFRSIFALSSLLIAALFITCSLKAQDCSNVMFVDFNAATSSPLFDTSGKTQIQHITARQLADKLSFDRSRNKELKFQMIVASSTGCGGMLYAMMDINKLKADYSDSIGIYWIVGDPQKACRDYSTAADRVANGIQVYAADAKYADKRDDRKPSDALVKELFPETKDDIVFTPKFLLVDCATGKLVSETGGKYSRYDVSRRQIQNLMHGKKIK